MIRLVVFLALVAAGCGVLQQAVPPGEASWALSPDSEITPETTEFVAMVTERACASGQSSEGRVVGPEITYADDAVTVTFGVRPRGANQDCPSNPPTAVAVTLSEPLGERRLLDGGSDPPREPPICANPASCE